MTDFRQHNLLPLAPNFRIVRIGKDDARKTSDNLLSLKSLILGCEDMYPGIGRWFTTKVIPGLKSSERIAYVAYEGENRIASAVLKLGKRSKFCHLRIHQDFQDLDLGQMFFTQMTLEVRHLAKEIHFTLPESLWSGKKHFFNSFGFQRAVKAHRQYRTGDPELACSAPLAVVWKAALERLPNLMEKFSPAGFSLDSRLLISMKPKHVESVFAGAKRVEVRKRFSRRWLGCRAVLYGSHPLSSLVGEATIANITRDKPEKVWAAFGPGIGAERREFETYAGSSEEVSAIEFTDVAPYLSPVGLAQLSHLVKSELRPPQSYCNLRADSSSAWTGAVAVAALLHGRFQYVRRTL